MEQPATKTTQATPTHVYWQAFGVWMLITGILLLLRFFGPTFFVTIKARDILFNSSLPWSYLLAVPLWFNMWAYIGVQLAASALNGFIFAGIVSLFKGTRIMRRHPQIIGAVIAGLALAFLHMFISSVFASPDSSVALTESGALRLLVFNFPASVIWLYEYSILTPINFIFYFVVGSLGYMYWNKRTSSKLVK